jgi:multiple sugar transport system substrate-binding protein
MAVPWGSLVRRVRLVRDRRPWSLAAVVAIAAALLAGCGGAQAGGNTLTWYINPDNGAQSRLAKKCTDESGGRYRIQTSTLPTAADAQREQLVRRLGAKDSSIDFMSLDPPFTAEFANAGYLRPFTDAEAGALRKGVLDAPLQSAIWKDKLVAAPFWANTQLLWYRKSAVRKLGVNPTAPDFTWDQMIDAAARARMKIGAQGARYEGFMVWVNALVQSAGGSVLTNNEAGRDAEASIDSPAGRRAARIIRKFATSPVAAPALSTALEEESRTTFQSDQGAFMVNWPYVWAAMQEGIAKGQLDKKLLADVGWARYPRMSSNQESKPPLGGIHLAISRYGRHRDLAVAAVQCLTTAESQKQNMLDSGNPVANGEVYDDPDIIKKYPMASLIRESINAAGPRPLTPYYTDVSAAIQRSWHPPGSVTPQVTPGRSAKLIEDVLHDRVLL